MIFPDWGTAVSADNSKDLPLYTEWAMDWERGEFALRGGQPYLVTGDEALCLWVRCALHPENIRFLYSAHSADYGNQLETLFSGRTDQGILENLLKKEIQETLMVSPYITAVDDFAFTRAGSRLTVCFTVHTVYNGFVSGTEVFLA